MYCSESAYTALQSTPHLRSRASPLLLSLGLFTPFSLTSLSVVARFGALRGSSEGMSSKGSACRSFLGELLQVEGLLDHCRHCLRGQSKAALVTAPTLRCLQIACIGFENQVVVDWHPLNYAPKCCL